jgi:D-alanyl-D-alanine carboxypeptidase/D-alanyl-D-alanine-endopeptidase (penicillin-binding protein 4)
MRRLTAAFALAALALTSVPAHAANLALVRDLPKPVAGGVPWTAHDIALLHKDLAKILAGAALRGAHVGLLAQDTTRGTLLIAQNADDSFQPASNFKLLVGSTALEKFGPAFTLQTNVLAAGTIANGTLTGDLYLRGGGDPHLNAKDLDAAAAAIAAAGITRVTGQAIGDASRYDDRRYPEGWDWDDLAWDYAPVITALSFDENVLHLYISPGAAAGEPGVLRADPNTPAITLDNQLMTGPAGSKDTSELIRPWDGPRMIRIAGSYPFGAKESGDIRPAAPDPAALAIAVFAQTLAAHGVTLVGGTQTGGAVPAGATVLWSHASEPMPEYMADFWWPSDNLVGELFLKELGAATAGLPGTDANGAKAERAFLTSIGVDPETVSISDGSGLSNYDRITPRALVAILQHDWNGPNRELVLEALPVTGVSGTLRNAFKGTRAEKNVFAKTGSISHVRTISGFIRTKRHGAVTFSFLVNDWSEGAPHASALLATLRAAVLSRFVTD